MNALPIADDWSADDLYRRYTHAPTVAISRRYHALYLRRLGHLPKEIADLLGVTPEAIRKWVSLARTDGLDRLARRAGGDGQPPKLDAARQAEVMVWVDAEPRLMLKQIQSRIAARWGISLSLTQVWHLLKRHDARRVVPRTRHYQADSAAQRRFKKVRQRMRQVRKGRYRLVFLDEAWWGLTTQLRRVWARSGRRPVQPVWGGRRWRPVIGAVEPATGRCVSLLVGGLNSDWFSLFLAHLAAQYPGERLIVVLDNAGWHTSGKVVVPKGITRWFQPPHAPEVNVMEQVWQWIRGHHTRGILFTMDGQLDTVLCDALNGLANDPAQVGALTNQHWLYANAST